LSNGVVSASNHALWCVLSNKVIWVLGHCWVDIPQIHNSEWESLFMQSCLLSTVSEEDILHHVSPFQMPQHHKSIQLSILGCDEQNLEKIMSDLKWAGHKLAHVLADGWSTAWHKRRFTLFEVPTETLLFYYHWQDMEQEIVHTLLLEAYGVLKKGVIIMDKRQDQNAALTEAETSGPSTQDRYCTWGPGWGTKKWCGNGEEKRQGIHPCGHMARGSRGGLRSTAGRVVFSRREVFGRTLGIVLVGSRQSWLWAGCAQGHCSNLCISTCGSTRVFLVSQFFRYGRKYFNFSESYRGIFLDYKSLL